MSSDLFMFDESFHQHSAMFNSEKTQLRLTESDPFSALSDSSIDSLLQELSEDPNTITEPQISSNLDQFESLSLYQQTHFANLQNSSDFSGGYGNYPVSAIKTEELEFSLGLNWEDCFVASQSYGCGEESAMMRLMQRNYSHGRYSYEEEKPWLLFQPRLFDDLFESSGIGQMRRVCSTGDLPTVIKSNQASATTIMEEANFKVGKYSAEERKEKIDRYRAKRSQRNFNKTIKYACRKTLADNRSRVRGRFARNDDAGDMPKSAPCSNAYEDEDDILLYNWHEEEDVGKVRRGGGGAGGCIGGENEKVDSS